MFVGLFFLSVKHFGIFEWKKDTYVLLNHKTSSCPMFCSWCACIYPTILSSRIYFPFRFYSRLDSSIRLSSLFSVHVSHNYLGYTSFFPSVLSSYMYFWQFFSPILQSPIITALVFWLSIFEKHVCIFPLVNQCNISVFIIF